MANDLADNAARCFIEADGGKVQRRQGTAGNECREEATETQSVVCPGQHTLRFLLTVKHPSEIKDHQGEQIGRATKKVEQQISDKGPRSADAVTDLGTACRLRESGIGRVVCKQRIPEDQSQCSEHVERALAQCPVNRSRYLDTLISALQRFGHM